MWKRCLLLMLFVWGCLLYAPTAMACEEGTPAYLADYQAFLREYGEALVEDRDTIRYWQVNAAAKVAGIDGTGYAFVWIDGDDVPMLLIGNPDSWHVWQAYTWSKGKMFSVKQISPFSSSEFPIVIVGKSPLSAGLVRRQVPLLHPAA